MHHLNQSHDMFHRRLRQNPVSQIKYMAGSAGSSTKHPLSLPPQRVQRCKQRDRIKIALHGSVETNPGPSHIEINPPVYPNHITTRLSQQL
jgi:hypothetical protein